MRNYSYDPLSKFQNKTQPHENLFKNPQPQLAAS